MHWNQFPVMGFLVVYILTKDHCKLEILQDMFTFFESSFRKQLQIVLCLIFRLLEFHRNSLWNRCIVRVISLGIRKTWTKNINFDKANVLKTIISPSRARFLRRHILKKFPVPIIYFFEKFCYSSIFLLYQNKSIKSFIVSLVKSIHLIPQTPIPVVLSWQLRILISLVLNLKTVKLKKLYSTVLLLNPIFLRKKIMSSE